jgi:DNA-binding NarL/FixJ family response regulator
MLPANILIVEDEVTIACDIAFNLESHGYTIVNIVHTAEDGIKVLKEQKVDLVMLDINLGDGVSGIALGKIIDEEYRIPFIYLTSYADSDTLDKAAHTFPASYLVKPFKEDDLAPAVKMALIRKQSQNDQRMPSLNHINRDLLSPLTIAEHAMLNDIWNGKTNHEMATDHFLSPNTIKTHVQNIYSKLGVHSKPQLIKYLRELK